MTANKLGRYELIRVLGKGAMGLVFEGRDPNLDRLVAIKTIRIESLSPSELSDYEFRFRTEARSAARLQHPRIVSVYDSDRDDDIAFLVMERIHGEDLKHYLDRGTRYTLDESLRIVGDLLDALDYAHQQGVIHRDVKPANLLIDATGRVKLTDFGVARMQDSGDHTGTRGSIVGTLKYMSPEQVQGLPIDVRADLFSAAVVLYQLLTGERPFNGENDFAVIHQIIDTVPAAPSRINPSLPTALDAVMSKALAKSRDQRYGSAREFAAALYEAGQQAADRTVFPPVAHVSGENLTAPGSFRLLTTPGAGLTLPGDLSSPSVVVQEMELVYWKDIKDSNEPDDLNGFLQRFPYGVYASLAQKRLQKLKADPRTAGSGDVPMARINRPATADEEATAAQLAALREALKPRASAGQSSSRIPNNGDDEQDDGGFAATTMMPRDDETVVYAPTTDPAPDIPLSGQRFRLSMPWLWAIGVSLMAGLVVFVGVRPYTKVEGSVASAPVPVAPNPGELADTAPPLTLPVASAALGIAPALVSPASATPLSATKTVQMTDRTRNAGANKNSPPIPSGGREPPVPASASAPAVDMPAPVPVAPVPVPAARPASAASQPVRNPALACEGRILLGHYTCMTEQCAKPGVATHPACVELRDAERRRREREEQRVY